MKTAVLAGLIAMLPAAINPAQATIHTSPLITALVCGGKGSAHIVVPAGGERPSQEGNQPCCAKGCHGGNTRKRFVRNN